MVYQNEHERLSLEASNTLAELLGVRLVSNELHISRRPGVDFEIRAAGQVFVVAFKKTTSAAPIAATVRHILEIVKNDRRGLVPVVAVPFMGDVGRRICAQEGVNWFDLSGNARIVAKGIRVIVEGHTNRFKTVGRPANLFAPKSSRVARWLLMHPYESFTQREVAHAVDVTESFVSQIVKRLELDGYIFREKGLAIRPKDPALLLEAFYESYQFSRHRILHGNVAARSGEALLTSTCATLAAQNIEYAATGLAAAWVYTHFAAFRIASVYLSVNPSNNLLEQLGFREDPRGANLWLVVPNDVGVFYGVEEKSGVRCVHPVQAYLDLKGHPERSLEAAQRLRDEYLKWNHSSSNAKTSV